MLHSTPLITLIVIAFALAFVLGFIAHKLKLSPIVGYLLAGVIIGPTTPGYIADLKLAHELAEIGVILLMFGVGLHFSWKDLADVKNVALTGAICQMGIATLMGWGVSLLTHWSSGTGILVGLTLSVASTVVLLRALEERHLLSTKRGKIAVSWLIVEDLAVVVILVVLPALASLFKMQDLTKPFMLADLLNKGVLIALGITFLKVATFMVLMLIVGKRFIPWMLDATIQAKSEELFRLSVLAIALGVAYGAAKLFGVSFALGAFFAGMILSESKLSQKAAKETLPLRDAFAVLFFVAMGMLLNPNIILDQPYLVLAVVLVIVLGKSIGAYLIMIAFGYPQYTAFTIAVSLAQIGEFSFILAELGVKLKILTAQNQDIILAGAIISILLNPMLFNLLDRFKKSDKAA
ncbi:MAG: cation:proton antiporter [Proteobacteria bacterium]|nr:cation:proton antiporter [Pseudomonadota bacterium]